MANDRCETIASEICLAVAELPDRNSPEDWPEAMLVTHDELRSIVVSALTAPVATEQAHAVAIDRESLIDLIEDNLHAVYHCTRVWAAWSVGTMSEDDFHEARGTELAPDLADAIIAKLAAATPAAPRAVTEPQDDLLVACITLNGTTLTVEADALADMFGTDDEQHAYELTFKRMTRAAFEALGDFNGF